jgi:biotin transport system substrate-specific component
MRPKLKEHNPKGIALAPIGRYIPSSRRFDGTTRGITMLKICSLRVPHSANHVLLLSAASLLCAIVVGLSAMVRIPIPGSPVPITLQTFALLACAGILTRGYALQMIAWYILLGIAGAPFFSGGSGIQHLSSPTGGYIIGFAFAAAITGFASPAVSAQRRRIPLFILATLSIYIPGLFSLHHVAHLNWRETFATGFVPFILFDVVKAVAASGTSLAIRKLLNKQQA